VRWVICRAVSRKVGVHIRTRAEICLEVSAPCVPLANSVIMGMLTIIHCGWKDETVKEKMFLLPLYAKTKKMESLTV